VRSYLWAPLTSTLAFMEDIVRVRARIELLPVQRSAGHEYYVSGIMPNHFFSGVDGATIGRVEFEGCERLHFGESCDAVVTFSWLPEWPPLTAGTAWRLQEGAKHVGNGQVIEVLP
jgi:hypothetical protein